MASHTEPYHSYLAFYHRIQGQIENAGHDESEESTMLRLHQLQLDITHPVKWPSPLPHSDSVQAVHPTPEGDAWAASLREV
jgi:hypothetical protein